MTDERRVDRPRIFATFPPSSFVEGSYIHAVEQVAAWCEAGACSGALIYTDNSLVDPWVVAQEVLARTTDLAPLVAVQPVYMHPYAVAKLIASIAHLYGRRLHLNMVAGGFVRDLQALDDDTEHDARYERLVEYTTIVQRLLADDGAVTFEGRWYRVHKLRLRPSVPPELRPGYMLSGSSDAGLAAARALGATAIQYPKPPGDYVPEEPRGLDAGIRIGIVARGDAAEAWAIAHERFPGDERGRMTHKLAMATSDSAWHRQLSALGEEAGTRPTYWLHPFENYKTFCPYLVGSYDEVASELAGYLESGFGTFILDVPRAADDLAHAAESFERAERLAARP